MEEGIRSLLRVGLKLASFGFCEGRQVRDRNFGNGRRPRGPPRRHHRLAPRDDRRARSGSTTPPCATARRRRASTSRSPTSCRIARELDVLGIDYVEGGWPGANPTDDAFFAEPARARRSQAVRVRDDAAVGAQCRQRSGAGRRCSQARTPVITLVGKSSARQAEGALGVSRGENLTMIADSIREAARHADEVMFDAEHFFDGFKEDAAYTLACLQAAQRGRGALDRALRHQRRRPAARGRGDRRARGRTRSRASGWASTPTTTPRTRSPTAWRPSAPAPARSRAR